MTQSGRCFILPLSALHRWSWLVFIFINTMFFPCFQRVHPLGSGSRCRFLGSGRRIRHRHRGWCWCPRYRATAQVIRRNDPYPHFRRGVGSIRSHRGHLPVHETVSCWAHSPVARSEPLRTVPAQRTGKSSPVARRGPGPRPRGAASMLRRCRAPAASCINIFSISIL